MQNNKDSVSVILCCYNSALRLPQTLKHLAKQQLKDKIDLEIILVDNASTDGTAKIAIEIWESFGAREILLRTVIENRPGLYYARERGLSEVKNKIAIFCDDDNWLSVDYVLTAWEILTAQPNIAALGGNIEGVFENRYEPEWFKHFAAGYAIGRQGMGELDILTEGRYLVGAGVCLNKLAYTDIMQKGYKLKLTGRTGNKVIGGEDVELCYNFKLAGYDVAYSDRLTLKHYMPLARVDQTYLKNMWRQYPYSWLIFEAYKVFLERKIAPEKYMSYMYWKLRALKQLGNELLRFPYYIYHKLRGNINYYLVYETNMQYNIYLIKNTETLLAAIAETGSKINLNNIPRVG